MKGLGKVAGTAEACIKCRLGDAHFVRFNQFFCILQALPSQIFENGAAKYLSKAPGQAGMADAHQSCQFRKGWRILQAGDQNIPGGYDALLLNPDILSYS